MNSRSRSHRRWLVVLCMLLLGAAGVAFMGAVLWPGFQLPQPSGPFGVGTQRHEWTDAGRQEIFSADPAARRTLVAQIWYPADVPASAAPEPYVADADVLAVQLARLQHVPSVLFSNLGRIRSNAVTDAHPAPGRWPVLLFLEGATGFRQMNSYQVEALVSHGYVVVAIDQPYTAAAVVFSDGRQAHGLPLPVLRPLIQSSYLPDPPTAAILGRSMPGDALIRYLADDVSFVLTQLALLDTGSAAGVLKGALALDRLGVLGVSLGGIVAAQVCQASPQIRACLLMDAPMPAQAVQNGLRQPAMWLTRDADTMRLERQQSGGWPEYEIAAQLGSTASVLQQQRTEAGYLVRMAGLFHIDLTDVPSWSPLYRWLGYAGPIGIERAHALVNAYSLAFFDRHLKDRPSPLLTPEGAPSGASLERYGPVD